LQRQRRAAKKDRSWTSCSTQSSVLPLRLDSCYLDPKAQPILASSTIITRQNDISACLTRSLSPWALLPWRTPLRYTHTLAFFSLKFGRLFPFIHLWVQTP
jgi:hypothetical protein